MRIPIFQVDAFTTERFSGNPAAICLLSDWPDDRLLQAVATENNYSETAFILQRAEGYDIRWFTPLTEVALCGHATLASSFVIFNFLRWPEEVIRFFTRKSGILTVKRKGELFEMDLPARPPFRQDMPGGLEKALGTRPLEVLGTNENLLVLVESETTIRRLEPDFSWIMKLEKEGVIVTARGDKSDFVSRYFAPRLGVPEDPVTGSSHCVLIPFWSKKLDKKQLHARQVSRRGGELFCEDKGERVSIAGTAVLYLKGTLVI
jgi:PhzF family phenazine biosynthesis protein